MQKKPKAPGTPAAPTVAGGTQSYPDAVKMRLLALQKNPMSYQVSFHG